MSLRSVIAAGAAAGLLVGAAPAPYHDALIERSRQLQPGYQCKIERRGTFGLVQSHFEIADTGKVDAGYVSWDAGNGEYQNPWFTAAFYRQRGGGYSLSNGYVSVMWHIWDEHAGKRPKPLDLSLELTANLNPIVSTRLIGKIERSGGPFHLQLDWLDAAAIGRGSTKLFLIARNKHRAPVRQVEIDRAMFARAEPVLLAVFVDVERMIADPRRMCTHTDDLSADDIVVT